MFPKGFKRIDRKLIEMEKTKLDKLLRHIRLVQDAGILLGKQLIEENRVLGISLISRVMIHDNSKFQSPEWENLWGDVKLSNNPAFNSARQHHWLNNPHHPEYYFEMGDMNVVDIAEMVCDWYARSCEHGTDFRGWIHIGCKKRWDIPPDIHELILQFSNLLIEQPMADFMREVKQGE